MRKNACLLMVASVALGQASLATVVHTATTTTNAIEVTPDYVPAIDNSPSPEWMIAHPGDMRFADGLAFDFRADDPTAFVSYKISFRTGKGHYLGVFEPGEHGRWNHVVVRKEECYDTKGEVAGWGNVTGVTISGQFGVDKTAKFRVANVGLLPCRPEILVVRGDSALKAFKWNRHDRSACSMTRFLSMMGVPVTQVSDMDICKGIPESVRLVVLPSNPSLPAAAADEMARYAARGGRFFACDYVDPSVRKLLGVKTGKLYDRRTDVDKPPVDGIVPTVHALEGTPAFVSCRFNTFIEPVAGEGMRPLAMFADASRKDVGIVALAQTSGGFFFSSGWRCWDGDARRLFRGVLLFVNPAWRDAVDHGMETAARIDAANEEWLKSRKPKANERRIIYCHNEKGYCNLGWAKSVAIAKGGGYNGITPNVAWGNCLFKKEAVECLEACRAQGTRCCLWKVCWRRSRKSQNDFPGRAMKDMHGNEEHSWMCPLDPANRKAEMEQFLELARLRPDGVQFDYIRYPGGWCCACDGCRTRFEATSGLSITNWISQVWSDPKVKTQWFAFRREVLTSFVREVSGRIRTECPGVKIYAATICNADSAANWFGQDWVEWCREGIIDYSVPMAYFQGNVAGLRQLLIRQRDLGRGLKGRVLPALGIYVWPQFGCDAMRLAQEIEVVRELGFEGFGVFELSDRCIATMPILRLGLMAE